MKLRPDRTRPALNSSVRSIVSSSLGDRSKAHYLLKRRLAGTACPQRSSRSASNSEIRTLCGGSQQILSPQPALELNREQNVSSMDSRDSVLVICHCAWRAPRVIIRYRRLRFAVSCARDSISRCVTGVAVDCMWSMRLSLGAPLHLDSLVGRPVSRDESRDCVELRTIVGVAVLSQQLKRTRLWPMRDGRETRRWT
eukprot:4139622-Prymnesium_polylepis.1